MKKTLAIILALMLWAASAAAVVFTDACGREVQLDMPQRVVSLYNSYGDAWRNAGGSLVGSITDGADGIRNLGSHLHPNMELLFELAPDFVLLSADVSTHGEIGRMLEDAGINCAFFSTPDWRSYMENMRLFTEITGRQDLYAQQLENVQAPIEACIAEAAAMASRPSCLLIRANSTAVKCRGSEGTVAGIILRDMGFENLADGESALHEGVSMESVLLADPDYIFVVLQGSNSDAAEANLTAILTGNPAWAGLTAVREGRFYILDRNLFHYHPNARWAQAYETILEIRKGEQR